MKVLSCYHIKFKEVVIAIDKELILWDMMRYLTLGKSGLRVSELCLGTMTFGTDWGSGGDEATSKVMYELYRQAGGNFFDTAINYTEGTSERYLGKFIGQERENVIVATKYSLNNPAVNHITLSGNSRKNMMRSIEVSLKQLNTDYIDLFYLHIWDFTTPVEEIMRGLDDLVRSGKVLYVGVSDTPAWIVAQMQTLASSRGYAPLISYQLEYSLLQRTPEREMIPAAEGLGLGVTAWAPIAGGALTGKYKTNPTAGRIKPESPRLSQAAQPIIDKVVQIAQKNNVPPAQVAIRWVTYKTVNSKPIIPIIGARNTTQLNESLGVIGFELSAAELQELEAVSAIELGFPHDFLTRDYVLAMLFSGQHHKFIK